MALIASPDINNVKYYFVMLVEKIVTLVGYTVAFKPKLFCEFTQVQSMFIVAVLLCIIHWVMLAALWGCMIQEQEDIFELIKRGGKRQRVCLMIKTGTNPNEFDENG